MSNKIRIVLLSVVLIMMLNILLPTMSAYAKSKDSSEVITGTYQFSSNEGKNIQEQNTFEYKDECFARSSFLGCKHLEVLSIQAASASKSWYGTEIDKDEVDPTENAHNITEMLKSMKFNDVTTNKYYTKEKKENSIGVAVGHKTIIQDGKSYTLLAVIPRSAGYKQEWAGNLIVGEGEIHEGFKLARDEILRFIKQYINENDIKGDLKVWTTGYSRGAAVSNILAGFFAGGGIEYFGEDVNITPEDVYCYTIATPRAIKNGISKNIELSVSGNRAEPEYSNDTIGEPYQYNKGGTVATDDTIYNGIRSIISPDDVFPLLAPEAWGFTKYGKVVPSNQAIVSENEMFEELSRINRYIYNSYSNNGEVKQFKRKTFYLKTLSIIDGGDVTTPAVFIKERLNGLVNIAQTNKIYKDEQYQDALKSFAGTYGMAETFFKNDSSNANIETGDAIEALAYTYLAYASEQLQKEGKAQNETEAITLALEDLLKYFSGEDINNEAYTVDDFIKTFAKYISDNENEPIADAVISGIVNIVPEDRKWFLSAFKNFDKNNSSEHEVTVEEGLKAYIKACYYGAEPGCYFAGTYDDPVQVRNLLCTTMILALSSDMPEVYYLLTDENGNPTGTLANFEEAVGIILNNIKTVKDDDNNIIKTYSNISEMADDKISNLLDNLLNEPIEQSGTIYGEEYKNDFRNHVNTLKDNITQAREIISELLFYSNAGFSTQEIIRNVATFADNAMMIPMAHWDEVYLAQARTANRYEEHHITPEDDEEAGQEEGQASTQTDETENTDTEENNNNANKNGEKVNPKTGDYIIVFIVILIISVIGLSGISFYKKKSKNKGK